MKYTEKYFKALFFYRLISIILGLILIIAFALFWLSGGLSSFLEGSVSDGSKTVSYAVSEPSSSSQSHSSSEESSSSSSSATISEHSQTEPAPQVVNQYPDYIYVSKFNEVNVTIRPDDPECDHIFVSSLEEANDFISWVLSNPSSLPSVGVTTQSAYTIYCNTH